MEIEECVKLINSTLEDTFSFKKFMNVALQNYLYDTGKLTCNGIWDRSQGKCIINVPPPPSGFMVNAGNDQQIKVTSFPTKVNLFWSNPWMGIN